MFQIKFISCSIFIFLSCNFFLSAGAVNDAKKVTLCYFSNWNYYTEGAGKFKSDDVDPNLCTHLIYAFALPDVENNTIVPSDINVDIKLGGYSNFTALKKRNRSLKTLISIGGWNEKSTRFSKLAEDKQARRTFAKNVVTFLRQHNFDGLDLNWQDPTLRSGRQNDRESYVSLCEDLRNEFVKDARISKKQRLLFSISMRAQVDVIESGYNIKRLTPQLDFMIILAYNFHTGTEPYVNHHSPLYSLPKQYADESEIKLTANYSVNYIIENGGDPKKMILALPCYGRSFTLVEPKFYEVGAASKSPGKKGQFTGEDGYLAYYEICANVKTGTWKVINRNQTAMGPIAVSGDQWVGYDDVESVKLKAKYVNEKGLGGLSFWTVGLDDFRGTCHGRPFPLINAANEILYRTKRVISRS